MFTFHRNFVLNKKLLQTSMFDMFVLELVKNTTENQPNIFVDRLNKMMNNGSMLSRRESIQPGYRMPTSNGLSENMVISNSRHSSFLSTSLNRPINKILAMPSILDTSSDKNDIITFLSRELEVIEI